MQKWRGLAEACLKANQIAAERKVDLHSPWLSGCSKCPGLVWSPTQHGECSLRLSYKPLPNLVSSQARQYLADTMFSDKDSLAKSEWNEYMTSSVRRGIFDGNRGGGITIPVPGVADSKQLCVYRGYLRLSGEFIINSRSCQTTSLVLEG